MSKRHITFFEIILPQHLCFFVNVLIILGVCFICCDDYIFFAVLIYFNNLI